MVIWNTVIVKMLEGWEIRQTAYLHRIRDTRIGYAITQWRIDLSHSMRYICILAARENAILSQVFEQAFSSFGKSNQN